MRCFAPAIYNEGSTPPVDSLESSQNPRGNCLGASQPEGPCLILRAASAVNSGKIGGLPIGIFGSRLQQAGHRDYS